MLDQNTDRMWFVIGAVIVGAAIIFIANSMFPTMFTNISGVFNGKIADMTTSIGKMTPNTGGTKTVVDTSGIITGILNSGLPLF